MINNKFFQIFFFVILFICILVGINISMRRYNFENTQKSRQVALSFRELKLASLYSGLDLKDYLGKLKKETEVSTICLEEDTLKDFENSGKITILKGSEIMNMHRVGHINRTILNRLYRQVRINPDGFYLLIDREVDFSRIKNFLSAEFGKDKVKRIKRYNILEVLDTKEDLMSLGLGISKENIKLVESYGFSVVYKLLNSSRLNSSLLNLKIRSFARNDEMTSVIFEGDTVLGYPASLKLVKEKLEDKHIMIGFVEFVKQNGIKYLISNNSKNVFTVHQVGFDYFQSLSKDKLQARYVRAIRERNMDMIFLHPFIQSRNEKSLLDFNFDFFNDTIEEIKSYGYVINQVPQFPAQSYFSASKAEFLMLAFGVFSTILFMISYFFKLSFLNIFFFYLVSMGSVYLSMFLGYFLGVSQALSLFVAIAFPTLAIISQFPQSFRKEPFSARVLKGCYYLVRVAGICFVGAVFIIGFLSDELFLKGIHRFWGVKLSFLLPLILIGLFFYLRPNRVKNTFYVLKRLYYAPVRTAGLVSIFFILIFLVIMIIRSGNLIVLPSLLLESEFRLFFEETFFVRPRTKEFLIGYPFLLLSFIYVDSKISRLWLWFFNIIGSVALISFVNSFCHLNTPLQISIYRSVLGVFLGVVFTFIYLFIYKFFTLLFRRRFIL
jgi:hypothetical protein